MKQIIVIAGPTASGKTSLSVELAKNLNCPIVSADSRQFYRELSIGTAKPTPDEMEGVPHYFIGSHSIHKPLSAGQFEKEATQKVEELFNANDTIIVVGGSGMFINALIYGTDQIPHQIEVREKWNAIHQEKGIEFLQKTLNEKDPEYFQKADIQNPARLIRALEVIEITGEKYSTLRKKQHQSPRYPTHFFVIHHPREKLYERINSRVDIMMKNGLLEEVKSNLQFQSLQPLNTVGYKELFTYLNGEISKEEAVELIKRNTRRYAKRQLTWFRKIQDVHWIDYGEDMARQVKKIVATKK